MTSSHELQTEEEAGKVADKCHTSYENVPARAARHQYGGHATFALIQASPCAKYKPAVQQYLLLKVLKVVCPVFF